MDNIIDIELTGRSTRRDQKLWQYDYGQVLRIAGKELPKVTEVQFSLKQSGGHTLDRIGTSNNGLLTVQIPNELLQNKGTTSDYTIYAFVYLSGDGYGNTKYMIQLPVESRPEPTDPSEDPSIDPSIFKDAVNAVNASAERAEAAEKSAKESADKAKEYADSAGKSKEDVEKARDNAISAIGTEKESALRGIASQTEASQNSIKQSIADATKKKTELDGAISNATEAKGNLDKAVQSAGNAKTELDTSVGKAGEAKTALDSSINSAGEKQLALDATVERANTVDASLKEQIESAEQIQANVEQIGKNTQAISSLNEDLDNILSPNLYNPAAAKANVAISSDDGSEMNGFSGWKTTDYIPVSKRDVLYFSSNNEPTPYSTGAFYDAQKKFISGFGNPNNNNNITVTSDGYARFSFGTAPVNLQIERGSRTAYVPYGEVKIKADVDNIKKDTGNIKLEVSEVKAEVVKIQEDHTNLFNKNTVTKGAVLSESGYLETSFSSWDSSDYIPVKPGMVLYFSSNELPIGVASTGAYFDADKKYLSGINNEPTVLTVPDGAYYLRFSKNGGLGDALNTLKIEQHGITKFTPYGELYVTVNESALPSSILPKWKGLKILTLGDSITAMGGVNGWTYWIKQYLIADKVVNVSVAGSTWQDKVANQTYDGNPQPSTDGNVMGNQVQKVLNAKANGDADYQDFDVITFSFGTNDSIDFSVQTKENVESQFITNYAQNNFTVVPLESVNRQTLAGAMRYGFQKLHEAYPNAVIFMCTPTQECYETFDSIYQKGDFINFIADRLGAETIDTRRCGIRNIYESQTTIDYDHPEQSGAAPIQTDLLDGIHTNENGAKKIAKYNAREIMKYFMIN